MSHVAKALAGTFILAVSMHCTHAPAPKTTDVDNPDAERDARMVAADPECREVDVAGALRIMSSSGTPAHIDGDGHSLRDGDRFVVFGSTGYAGVVVASPEPGWSCRDACPEFLRAATWIDGQPSGGRAVAVGPTDATFRAGRVQFTGSPDPDTAGSEWQTSVSVDLDGDGRSDVEERMRHCGCWHVVQESRVRSGEQWTTSVRVFVPTHDNPNATPCPAVP
jgi:hypothetical protein